MRADAGRAQTRASTREADVLDALPALVALLDADGTIVLVNESWRRVAVAEGLRDPQYGVGSNYLKICDAVTGPDADEAQRAVSGIRAVLSGATGQFSMEYSLQARNGTQWYLLLVTPVGIAGRAGASVMHLDVTARRLAEGMTRRLGAAMDAITDAVFVVDRLNMKLIYVNAAACRLHGTSREDLLQQTPWEIMSCTREDIERTYDRVVARGGVGEIDEVHWRRRDGSRLWIEIRRHSHCLDGVVNLVVMVRDITERKEAESRIGYLNRVYAVLSRINNLIVRVRSRDELFREACAIIVEQGGFPGCWIALIDRSIGKIVPKACAGLDREYQESLQRMLSSDTDDGIMRSVAARVVRDREIFICNDSRTDTRILFSNEHERHGIRSLVMLPLIVADEPVGVFALYASETEFFHEEEMRLLTELTCDVAFAIDHIAKQERLDYLAYYDALTGLANRTLFLDRLAQFVDSAEGAGGLLAVGLIDLERFRNVNDSLGRSAGDTLLRLVADWLVRQFEDDIVLCRVEGDRFAVVLPNVRSEEDAVQQVETLINSFAAQSFSLNGEDYRISMRMGVAMYPADDGEAETLFKQAGAALNKAKIARDRYLFYAQRMTETVAGRLGLENQLRQALEREEFVLHYQPKVDVATGAIAGAEALLRWNDPRTGIVPPGRFIPVLEETGLIFDVGRWVLQQAVKDYLRWVQTGMQPLRIAVNVSPLQLRDRSFVKDLRVVVGADTPVAGALELEITESLIMENVKLSITALEDIRQMGISVAIDDFGTGYSSLSQLARLPIDTLKIDRSFVNDMTTGPQGMALVTTIINLAHSLKLRVVAEGVETAEQMSMLRLLTCDEVQGYLISKPLPVKEFEQKYVQPLRA